MHALVLNLHFKADQTTIQSSLVLSKQLLTLVQWMFHTLTAPAPVHCVAIFTHTEKLYLFCWLHHANDNMYSENLP